MDIRLTYYLDRWPIFLYLDCCLDVVAVARARALIANLWTLFSTKKSTGKEPSVKKTDRLNLPP